LSKNLWRFPQLIALAAIASKNILYRILTFPLYLITVLILATSCINRPNSDTDARVGGWLLMKALEHTILGSLAGNVWKKRLITDYFNGMKDVFMLYFGADHPLAKYMVKF
jgi:hypothetical protein